MVEGVAVEAGKMDWEGGGRAAGGSVLGRGKVALRWKKRNYSRGLGRFITYIQDISVSNTGIVSYFVWIPDIF